VNDQERRPIVVAVVSPANQFVRTTIAVSVQNRHGAARFVDLIERRAGVVAYQNPPELPVDWQVRRSLHVAFPDSSATRRSPPSKEHNGPRLSGHEPQWTGAAETESIFFVVVGMKDRGAERSGRLFKSERTSLRIVQLLQESGRSAAHPHDEHKQESWSKSFHKYFQRKDRGKVRRLRGYGESGAFGPCRPYSIGRTTSDCLGGMRYTGKNPSGFAIWGARAISTRRSPAGRAEGGRSREPHGPRGSSGSDSGRDTRCRARPFPPSRD